MNLVLSLTSSFVVGLVAWFTQRWLQRKGYVRVEPEVLQLEHKRAPTDLLRYVKPGTSTANMREQLGAPFSTDSRGTEENPDATIYRYKFSNLNLEAYSKDGATIHIMTLVLPSVRGPDCFSVPMLGSVEDFVLGRDYLGKVLEEQDNPDWRTSSKHGLLAVEKYYGNPGQYRRYRFGVFTGPSAPYDLDTGSAGFRDTSPAELKINYFSLTGENGGFLDSRHYNFYEFR